MNKDKIEFETVAEVTGKAQLKDTRKRKPREVFDCTFTTSLKYLLRQEWSMGNGQCPECCGSKPDMGWWTETVGHKPGCELAKAIESAGGKVEWEHSNPEARDGIHPFHC